MKISNPTPLQTTGSPDALVPSQVAAVGTSASAARADHAHEVTAGTPVDQAFGDVAATGSNTAFAPHDHRHGMMSAPRRAMMLHQGHVTGTGTLGNNLDDYFASRVGNAGDDAQLYFSGRLPSDFTTLRSAVVICETNLTGNLRYAVDTEWAANGENHTAAGGAIATTTLAMSSLLLTEIDISAALAGVAALDAVGIKLSRVGADVLDTIDQLNVMGIYLEWD